MAQHMCNFCNKKGHQASNCWLNPKSPKNRLRKTRLTKEQVDESDVEGNEGSSISKKNEKKSTMMGKHRSNMARTSEIRASSDKIYAGFGYHCPHDLTC